MDASAPKRHHDPGRCLCLWWFNAGNLFAGSMYIVGVIWAQVGVSRAQYSQPRNATPMCRQCHLELDSFCQAVYTPQLPWQKNSESCTCGLSSERFRFSIPSLVYMNEISCRGPPHPWPQGTCQRRYGVLHHVCISMHRISTLVRGLDHPCKRDPSLPWNIDSIQAASAKTIRSVVLCQRLAGVFCARLGPHRRARYTLDSLFAHQPSIASNSP